MKGTSRKRVLDAVGCNHPDQVPVDFGGHRSSGIMAIAYRKLRRELGLEDRLPRVYDMIQQLAIVEEDVLERFGIDTVEMGRGFATGDDDWKSWTLPDGSPCLIPAYIDVRKRNGDWLLHSGSGKPVGVQREGMLYFDQIHWPYLEGVPDNLTDLPAALADVMWSVPTPPYLAAGGRVRLANGARALRESTDRAIIGLFGGNIVEIPQFLCRIDNFLMLLAADPGTVHRLLDRLVEVHLENLERYLDAVGPYIDIVLFGDDMGAQTGPQFSPAMYREFFKPRHAILWKKAKELADVKVMLHCCGGIRPLMDDLIESGLDTTNPVQTSCEGMAPQGLVTDFGGRLCLWGGGCDTRQILPRAQPDEVRRHVLERLRLFAPTGGFVFQQVHNIMADVPPQNVIAMFDAVREYNDSEV